MNSLAPLPVAVPLAGAAVILCLNPLLSRRAAQVVAMAVVLAEVAIAVVLLHETGHGTIVYWFGGWTPHGGVALGVSFTVDQLGAGGALLAGVVTAAAVATTHGTLDDAAGLSHALLLTLLAAMAGFCLTGDLFNLFVFFELMAVSAFALTAYHSRSLQALRGALNFAITNTVGAFLVLIGIALLYSRTGALNLAQIGRQLASAGPADRLTIIALALILVGFMIKAAVVPFHFWLVDTAAGAPIPLAMILAGVLDTLGVYAIARVYWTVFAVPVAGHHHAVQTVLVTIGALSAVGGGALAVVFRRPRRRLAFVMVAHTGILLIGVGCLTAQGVAASALYAVGDGTVKAALWAGLALLGFEGPTDDTTPLPGLTRARRNAGLAVLTAGGLATAGLPLFATGIGKAAIEDAVVAAGDGWVLPVVVIAAALTGAAVLDIVWTWAREAQPPGDPAADAGGPWVPAFSCAAVLLAVSAAASFTGRWAATAAAGFVNTRGYQQRVLEGIAARAATSVPHLRLSTGGALLDLLAVAGAIIMTAGLSNEGVGRRVRGSTLRAAAARLHDGSIGDSATWATLGTATVALVFAVSLR